MEVDRILYIFGSFSRKKQDKRKSLDEVKQLSISAGNSPLHVPRVTRPISQNLHIAPRTSAYGETKRKSQVLKDWECGLCKKELVEPRLLGCLHSFCTRCLQGMHQEGEGEAWSELDGGSVQIDPGESGSGSAGSGYESDLRHSGSEGSWDQKAQKYGIYTRKISGKSVNFILCPTCGYETQLPLGGIAALPLNYVLLRKMTAAGEGDGTSVLCDLCNTDNKAESRCSQCVVSVCSSCGEAHGRQKSTARHSLHPLDPGSVKYCSQHPRGELSVYCATCQEVICRDCCIVSHSGHALANASRAAAERARILKDACDRTSHVPENVERASRILNEQTMDIDTQISRVEDEVHQWGQQYRAAVDSHVRALCVEVGRERERHRRRAQRASRELGERADQAGKAVQFAKELLEEAKEDELLSLSGPVLRRLERLCELTSLTETPRCELRFAPSARGPAGLCGRLLTRAPEPAKCVLRHEGLQDLRVDVEHEVILELRDSAGDRIWGSGEQVAGYFRRRDSSARPAQATVTDRNDGTYAITFKPSSPGAYLLAVTLNNTPIKGSPFPCAARSLGSLRPHAGKFHCCTFCSSGGRRDVPCGCGAVMPGGYQGCGHGHAGWPGAKHWSCCGSTQRRGLCPRPQTQLYQFHL